MQERRVHLKVSESGKLVVTACTHNGTLAVLCVMVRVGFVDGYMDRSIINALVAKCACTMNKRAGQQNTLYMPLFSMEDLEA